MATLNGVEFQILTIEWATYQNNVIQEVIGGDTVVVHSQGYKTDPVKIQGRVRNEKEIDAFQEEFYSGGALTFIKDVSSGRQYQIYALGNIKQEDSSNDKSQTGIIFNCLVQLAYPYMESSEITTRLKTITTQNQEWSADDDSNDIKTNGNVDAVPDIKITADNFSPLSSNPIGEPSFETITGWSYAEVDTNGSLNGQQSTNYNTDGTYSYQLGCIDGRDIETVDYCEITRTVDFTNIDRIIFDYRFIETYHGYEYLRIYIDTNEIFTDNETTGDSGTLSGIINCEEYNGNHILKIRFDSTTNTHYNIHNPMIYIDNIISQEFNNIISPQIYNIIDATVKCNIANTILSGTIYRINNDNTGTIDYDDDFTTNRWKGDKDTSSGVTYDDTNNELDVADDGYIYYLLNTKFSIKNIPTLTSRINITSGIPTIQISSDANTWYNIDTAIIDDIETIYSLDSDGNLSLIGETEFYLRIDCVKAAPATCSIKYFKLDINIHTIYAKNPKITKGSSASTFRIDQDSSSGMACIIDLIYRDKWWV